MIKVSSKSCGFLIAFIIITLGYAVIRLFIIDLGEIYTKKVNIYKLKEGMITIEAIDREGLKVKLKKEKYRYPPKDTRMGVS